MAAAVYDSAGESIDLLQTVRHQAPSSSSSSSHVVVMSSEPRHAAVVWPTSCVSRHDDPIQRRALGKQRARLVLPVAAAAAIADEYNPRCNDGDDGDDDEALDVELHVERASATRHCRCCCQCATRHCDVTDVDSGHNFRRRRSTLDDDNSDTIATRDHLTTSGLDLPTLFVTPAARSSGAHSTWRDSIDTLDACSGRQRRQRKCLYRWWTQLFSRQRHEVARRRHDHDADDDCWRLFPGRTSGRSAAASRGACRRSVSGACVTSLNSSPICADDSVIDVQRISPPGDGAPLTKRCRSAAAANKSSSSPDSRRRCTRALCIIIGGMSIAMVGLLVGGLVLGNPNALHHYSKCSRVASSSLLMTSSFSHPFTLQRVAHYFVVVSGLSLHHSIGCLFSRSLAISDKE